MKSFLVLFKLNVNYFWLDYKILEPSRNTTKNELIHAFLLELIKRAYPLTIIHIVQIKYLRTNI